MKIEIRNNSVILDGYVNAVARDSKELHEEGKTFIEQIEPKAFDRAIKRANNILCLLDHDHSKVLGSTKEGTVDLREDNIGLRATCTITSPEVIRSAKENKLRGWSFGFSPLRQKISKLASGIEHRVVEELNLFEVSIIDDKMVPAYDGTSIEERAENLQIRTSDFEDVTINIVEPEERTKEEEHEEEKPEAKTENKADERVSKYYETYKNKIKELKGDFKEWI